MWFSKVADLGKTCLRLQLDKNLNPEPVNVKDRFYVSLLYEQSWDIIIYITILLLLLLLSSCFVFLSG